MSVAEDEVSGQPNFVDVCSRGLVEEAQILLALTGEDRVNVHAGDEEAWRSACKNGHL